MATLRLKNNLIMFYIGVISFVGGFTPLRACTLHLAAVRTLPSERWMADLIEILVIILVGRGRS